MALIPVKEITWELHSPDGSKWQLLEYNFTTMIYLELMVVRQISILIDTPLHQLTGMQDANAN